MEITLILSLATKNVISVELAFAEDLTQMLYEYRKKYKKYIPGKINRLI